MVSIATFDFINDFVKSLYCLPCLLKVNNFAYIAPHWNGSQTSSDC